EAKSRLRLPVRERSSSTLSLSHRPSRNRANARRSDNAPDLPAALVSHLRVCCLCGIRQRCCETRDLDEMPAQHRFNGRRKIHVSQQRTAAHKVPCVKARSLAARKASIPRVARSSLLALQQVANLGEQHLLLGQGGRPRRLGLHHLISQPNHTKKDARDDES